ncbi:hypothetical protein KR009_008595, partial [Drosophila setifemur]
EEEKPAEVKPVEKPPPPEEPPLIDWDNYWKNRGLISTQTVRKKEEYTTCSIKKSKKDQEKSPKKPVCCSSCPVKNRENYVPQCPGPGQKGKKNKDYLRCFACNMVCQKLDMPGWVFECQDSLQIKANVCRGCKVCLDSTRINVNCLPEEFLKTFQMEAECLARQLKEGISIALVYRKKEIGRGCYFPPRAMIVRMMNEFSEIVHDAKVELTCRGCTVGMCSIRFSMLMRCQTLKEVADGPRLAGGQEQPCSMDRNVDPQDAAFVSGGSYSSSSIDPCAGFMPCDMDVEPSDFGSCDNQEPQGVNFCGCQEQIPQLVDMAGPYPVYSCPDDAGCVTFEPPGEPGAQFTNEARTVLGEGSTNRMSRKLSSPKLRQMHISSVRSCQLCGEDVSWLPKVAACPYCGYKMLPNFKEKPYDERTTAQQILMEHLDNPVEELSFELGSVEGCPRDVNSHGDNERTSEAFEAVIRDYQLLKRSIRNSSMTKACLSATQRQTRSSVNLNPKEEPMPQDLAKVFAELRDLFKEKTVEKPNIQEICSEACSLAKAQRKGKSRSPTKERSPAGGSADPETDPKNPCYVPKKKPRRIRTKRPFKSRYYSLYSPKDPNRPRRQGYVPEFEKVPSHMGWLWTAHPLASKPGWRPGAIRRSIREMMRYFLKDYPVDSIPISKYMSYYKNKQPAPHPPGERAEDLVQVPTLHIEKKNDVFTITLRPLKNAQDLARSANPYANMKPVQFRIVRDPLIKEIRDLKRCLKGMGFSKCSCHKPVMQCYCRSFLDKKLLVEQVRQECDRRRIDTCEDDLVLSDTSDSEDEFDFAVTPPAGMMHPERLKTSHVKNMETQYDEADWTMPAFFQHPPNPAAQYASCVMGERKDAFKWIYGKGMIDEDPKPPKMRNMPKKKKKKQAAPGRVAGGFERGRFDFRTSSSCDICSSNNPGKHEYSTDSDLPLSGTHMKLLDRAAYPPTAPQRMEPWARELEGQRNRERIRHRVKKLVRFDTSHAPRSSDSYN